MRVCICGLCLCVCVRCIIILLMLCGIDWNRELVQLSLVGIWIGSTVIYCKTLLSLGDSQNANSALILTHTNTHSCARSPNAGGFQGKWVNSFRSPARFQYQDAASAGNSSEDVIRAAYTVLNSADCPHTDSHTHKNMHTRRYAYSIMAFPDEPVLIVTDIVLSTTIVYTVHTDVG